MRTSAHLPKPPLKSTVRRGLVFLTDFPSASCRAAASSCSRTFASSTGGGCGPVKYRFGVHSRAGWDGRGSEFDGSRTGTPAAMFDTRLVAANHATAYHYLHVFAHIYGHARRA